MAALMADVHVQASPEQAGTQVVLTSPTVPKS